MKEPDKTHHSEQTALVLVSRTLDRARKKGIEPRWRHLPIKDHTTYMWRQVGQGRDGGGGGGGEKAITAGDSKSNKSTHDSKHL